MAGRPARVCEQTHFDGGGGENLRRLTFRRKRRRAYLTLSFRAAQCCARGSSSYTCEPIRVGECATFAHLHSTRQCCTPAMLIILLTTTTRGRRASKTRLTVRKCDENHTGQGEDALALQIVVAIVVFGAHSCALAYIFFAVAVAVAVVVAVAARFGHVNSNTIADSDMKVRTRTRTQCTPTKTANISALGSSSSSSGCYCCCRRAHFSRRRHCAREETR